MVIVCDVIEHNALLVVESNMDLPVLPINNPPLDFEGDALWLCDIDRFDICPVTKFLLNGFWMVVVRLRLAKRSADIWDIDVDNFAFIGVKNRTEIEWE